MGHVNQEGNYVNQSCICFSNRSGFGLACSAAAAAGPLGMLLAGIVLGPYVWNLLDGSLLGISADLRQLALIIILTRAGLSLNLQDLKKSAVRRH